MQSMESNIWKIAPNFTYPVWSSKVDFCDFGALHLIHNSLVINLKRLSCWIEHNLLFFLYTLGLWLSSWTIILVIVALRTAKWAVQWTDLIGQVTLARLIKPCSCKFINLFIKINENGILPPCFLEADFCSHLAVCLYAPGALLISIVFIFLTSIFLFNLDPLCAIYLKHWKLRVGWGSEILRTKTILSVLR